MAVGRRQRNREEKTQRLLKAAMEMIVESGFDGLTMPGLAERAHVAVGGLYRYFSSKGDLLASLQIHSIQQLRTWIEERRDALGVQGLRQSAFAVESFSQAHQTSFALLELAVADPRRILDDASAQRVQAEIEPILLGVAQCIVTAQERGELAEGNPMQRTLALWGVVFGCLHFRKRDSRMPDDSLRSGPVLRNALDALIAGWGHPRHSGGANE